MSVRLLLYLSFFCAINLPLSCGSTEVSDALHVVHQKLIFMFCDGSHTRVGAGVKDSRLDCGVQGACQWLPVASLLILAW